MKSKNKLNASKFLKNFEIGKNKLTQINGGTNPQFIATGYYIAGSEGCSISCPDITNDYKL